MTTWLSGKELVDCASKKPDIVLPVKGPKEIIPTKKWVEKKQIESALELRKNILKDERIEKKHTLAYADWIEEKQMAIVTEKRGSCWHHCGHYENSELYIYPEEILHLMEMNCLILKYEKIPVSIQQAYSILIGKTVTLNEFRVYSTLSKQGYKIIRFHENQLFYSNDQTENKPSTSGEQTVINDDEITEGNSSFKKNSNDIYINSDSSSDDCLILNENSTPTKRNGKQTEEKKKTDQSLCLSKKTKVFEMLPDCIRKQEITIYRPKSIYIPKNINITKRSYKINLQNLSPKLFRSNNNAFLQRRETNLINRRLQNDFADNSFFWNFIHKNYLLKQSVANLPFNNERFLLPYSNWRFQSQNSNRSVASTSSETSIKDEILQDMLQLYSLYLSLNQNDVSNTYLASIISLFKKYNKIFQRENETQRLSLSSDNEVKLIPTPNKSVKRRKRFKNSFYQSIESSSDESEVPAKTNGAKKEFRSWIPEDSWGHPVYPQKKHRGRFENMSSFNEYMDSIKEISCEPGIESWNQANEIYDDRKVVAMVCISDEEMEEEVIENVNNLVPILEPEDCVTVEKVLNKLQIIETETFEHVKPNDENCDIKVLFNLYPPSMKTLKSSPLQIPLFFVAVLSAYDPFPNLSKLATLKKKLKLPAPLLLAVVSFDSISFLQMENITLPIVLPDNEKIDIDNPFDFD